MKKILLFALITVSLASSSCRSTNYSSYTVSCIGDSITWGAVPKTGAQLDKPYPVLLKETLNFGHVCNYGVGSSTVTNDDGKTSYAPMVERINKITTSSNIIIMWGGTNDYGHGCKLGTFGSKDKSNFYGALYQSCVLLKERETKYNTLVIFMTPLPANYYNLGIWELDPYVNAIIETCSSKEDGYNFNFPVLNLYKDSGFEEEWVEPYSDGLHPSQNYVTNNLVPKIVNFIKSVVK